MKTYTEQIEKGRKSIWGNFSLLQKFLKCLEKSSENILWVKMAKGFIHENREI